MEVGYQLPWKLIKALKCKRYKSLRRLERCLGRSTAFLTKYHKSYGERLLQGNSLTDLLVKEDSRIYLVVVQGIRC